MPRVDLSPIRRAPALTPLILTLAAAGCDGLLDTDQEFAENAQILVTGSSPVPMLLILSNRFALIVDEDGRIQPQIESADTFTLELPINRTYPLGDQFRVLVRLQNSDSSSTATVNMRVLLDGKDEQYNQNATMKDSYLQYIFNYF